LSPGTAEGYSAAARELSRVFAEREERYDAESLYPEANIRDLFDRGFFASTIPTELGGGGISLPQYIDVVEHLAEGSPSTALLYAMPSALVALAAIPREFVPAQHRAAFEGQMEWIAREVEARRIFAVANSEPGAGGRLSETKSTAVHVAGTFRLTGRKSFCSFGPHAHFFMCAARNGTGPVDAFLVSREAPGLKLGDRWSALGMRSTESVSLAMEDAPAEALLGYPGMLEGHNMRHWSTLAFAAVFLGAGRALFDAVRFTSAARSALGQTWLAEFHLFLEAAGGFLRDTAGGETWPLSAEFKRRTLAVKTFVTQGVAEHAGRALTLGGGSAYTGYGPVQRLVRDAVAGPLLRPPLPFAYETLNRELTEDEHA
jgi:alkylation response protein AidB-like acyl-CoA dehydrogenase